MIWRVSVLLNAALPSARMSAGSPPVWDDTRLKPFVMNHREGASSLADVSFLLDPPAGGDGFIRVQDGHLITLRELRGAVRVRATALDGAGRPIGAPVHSVKSADGWLVRVGEPVTAWYLVEVARR
jgi:hypothetical protein